MASRKPNTSLRQLRTTTVENELNIGKEIKDLKDLMEAAMQRLHSVESLHTKITDMEKIMEKLKKENDDLRQENISLTRKCENTEQKLHNRCVVLSGQKVVEAIAKTKNSPSPPYRIPYLAAEEIIEKHIKTPDPFEVVEAKLLGPPPKTGTIDKRPLYVELDTVLSKKDVIHKAVTNKDSGIFANEYLVGHRRHLLKMLLEFRKTNRKQKLQVYSKDGTIYVKTENSITPTQIKSERDLEGLIRKLECK